MRAVLFILGSLSAYAYRVDIQMVESGLKSMDMEDNLAQSVQDNLSQSVKANLSQSVQYFANASAPSTNPCSSVPDKYCNTDMQIFENKRNKFTRGSRAERNLCHTKDICVPIDIVCVAGYGEGKTRVKVCNAASRPKPWKQVPMMEVPMPDPEDEEASPAKSKERPSNSAGQDPAVAVAVEKVKAAPSNAEIAEQAVNACIFVPMKYCKMPDFENKRNKFTAGWYEGAKKAGANYDCAKEGSCVPAGFRCHRVADSDGKKWCGACEIQSTWKSTIGRMTGGYSLETCQ